MEDTELLREALQLFTEEMMTELLTQCQRAIQAGDLSQAAEICHTLKGTSANLSMQPLADKAKEIALAAKASDKDRVEQEYPFLSSLFDATPPGNRLLALGT